MNRLRHNAPPSQGEILNMITDNLMTQQNKMGVLLRSQYDYRAVLIQGGVDALMKMLAEDLTHLNQQHDIAVFRAQKEHEFLEQDVDALAQKIQRLTSPDYEHIRAPYHLYFSYPESERF